MSAIYTFDIFSTLDGYASHSSSGDLGGYWGKQGPEFPMGLGRQLILQVKAVELIMTA